MAEPKIDVSIGQPIPLEPVKNPLIGEPIPVNPPGWGEVIGGIPTRAGLGIIEAGGGFMQNLGDLIHSDSLSSLGAEVGKNARGASADETPAGMSLPQEVISGGAESALTMLPALAAGPGALVPAGIGMAAGQQYGQRYSQLKDAGFETGRSMLHSSIEALAEGLGEAVALPVLTKSTRPLLNKLYHFMARDLVGEEFTTAVEQASAMLSDKPNMTWGEFLNGMMMTALQTPVAAGLQVGAAHGIDRARAAVRPTPQEQPPGPPPAAGPTPGEMGPPAPIDFGPQPLPVAPGPTPAQVPQPPENQNPPPPPAVPPEVPGATPQNTPQQVEFPTTWNRVDTPGGAVYFHNSGQYRIADGTDGWHLIEQQPDGSGVTVHLAKTKEDLVKAVENAALDTPNGQNGWQRVGLYRLENPNGYYIAGGPMYDPKSSWLLFSPANVPLGHFAAGDIAGITKKMNQDLSPAPIPVTSKGPIQLGYMLSHTPQQMLAQGIYDPEIFNGYRGLGGVRVANKRVGINQVQGVLGNPETLDTPEKIKAHYTRMVQETGVDPFHPDQASAIYNNAVLNHIYNNPENVNLMADQVKELFGGNLDKIAELSRARRAEFGVLPPLEQGAFNLAGNAKTQAGLKFPGLDTKGNSFDLMDPKTAPGVYLDPAVKNSKYAQRLAAWVDHLRMKYAPELRLLLGEDSGGGAQGIMNTGAHTAFAPNFSRLRVSNLLSNLDHAKIQNQLYTVSHEFAHAIATQMLMKAPAHVRAEITRSYLEYTSHATKQTGILEYLIKHHGLPRDKLTSPGEKLDPNSRDFHHYIMSEAEYLADQGAMFFLHREQSAIPKMSQETQTWFQQVMDVLRKIWSDLNLKFHKNVSWADWLDTLAKTGTKVSSWHVPVPPNPGKPVAPSPKAKAYSKEQLLALYDRRRRLVYALIRGKVPTAELPEQTKDIRAYNWNAAWDLATKYGIPESWYGGRFQLGSFSDTGGHMRDQQLMSDQLKDGDISELTAKSNKAISAFNWFLQRTMTAVQLRKKFGESVPGVKDFVDNLEKMWSYRSRWKAQADERIKEMKKVPAAQRAKVFDLLLEEDKNGKFASSITTDVAGKRHFQLSADAAKKAGLTEQGVKLYEGLRKDFDAALDEMEHQAISELERTYPNGGPALIKAEAELRDGFAKMRESPYVPHTRFGDHTVSVRNSSGMIQEFYQLESERAAKMLEAKLRKESGKDLFVSRGKLTEVQRSMMGMPPQMIAAMKSSLNLSPEQIAQFEDILKNMSHGASFVRRFKRRKDIAGWADDAENFPRAYADYMSRFANHVSRLNYNHRLSDSISSVRDQANTAAKMGINTTQLNELTSWLGNLHEYVNNPGQEYANQRAAATLWYLGLNAKSALVNAASVPMVTLPYLSSRVGWARAVSSITQAYTDIGRQFVRKNALTDDERKMLEYLREQNKIDASFAAELAGLREGGRLADQTALGKPAAAAFAMKYYGMLPFQKMEVLNREVTALAAYRLAREQRNFDPNDPDGFDKKAADQAGAAIQDTQNENAQWNRPELMRGRKSILTMFMGYQQNLLYQMMGGDKSWMRMLAVQMMVAGLMGVPFAKDADALIKWFARKVFGSDISAERAMREYLKTVMDNPDWILNGAAHNVFGMDLSGSLGQGRVIPGIDALASEGDFPSRLANAAGDVGGAGFSIALNAMKAIASNDPDTLRRFQRTMPEAAKAMIEGGNMLASNKALDGAGHPIADVTDGEAYMRMLGFQLSNVTEEKGKRFAQKDSAQFWLTRRAYVMALWQLAMDRGDPDTRASAMKALQEFNDEAPDGSLKITRDQVRQSITQHARSGALAEQDIGPTKTVQGTYQRIGELYR